MDASAWYASEASNDFAGGTILSTTYEDVNGETGGIRVAFGLGIEDRDYYENTGIRKGVLLARYADTMKAWILDERQPLPEFRSCHPCFMVMGYVYPTIPTGPWANGREHLSRYTCPVTTKC